MNKLLIVTLPEQAVCQLMKSPARVAQRGDQPRHPRHVKLNQETRPNLRRQLANSQALNLNAALDRQLAEDWFAIEQEASDRARR